MGEEITEKGRQAGRRQGVQYSTSDRLRRKEAHLGFAGERELKRALKRNMSEGEEEKGVRSANKYEVGGGREGRKFIKSRRRKAFAAITSTHVLSLGRRME